MIEKEGAQTIREGGRNGEEFNGAKTTGKGWKWGKGEKAK